MTDRPLREPAPLSELLAALPVFLMQFDTEGRMMFINRLAPGFTAEQVRGSSIDAFLDPASAEAMRACFARVLASGRPDWYATVGAASADGKMVHYHTIMAPLLADGKVASIVLLSTEESPLAEANRALAASQTKLELVLEVSGIGLFTFDPATSIGNWDHTICRILGISHQSDQLAHMLEMVAAEDRPSVEQEIAGALATGRFGPIEYRIRGADGIDRWVQNSGARPPGHDIIVGSMLDITERKRREASLAEAQRMESIGRLAGGVAHDFNNMLTVILSYAELARRSVPEDSAAAADLAEIRDAAERSRALTARLLSFARQQAITRRGTDMTALVEDLRRLLATALGPAIELVTQLDSTRIIEIDPPQFEQLLLNLASNARDAMRGGGRVVIATRDLDLTPARAAELGVATTACIEIEVRDEGEGIPAALLGRVFEPFFTTKPPGRGTGLGLAQCYGVVKQHGGHIEVQSEVARGTNVRIVLPAARCPVAASKATVATPGGGDQTILLAEDDAAIRALLARFLGEQGYHVIAASDGLEALTLARSHDGPIHLVLSDVVMPLLGGVALAAAMRELKPGIPVLLMSGYSDQVVDASVGVVTKPFLPDELLERIRTALG